MSVETVSAEHSFLAGDARSHLGGIIGVYAAIGLGTGLTVLLVGNVANSGLAGVSLGGLMLWLLPYIGPALAGVLGTISGATTRAPMRSAVLTVAIAAVLGYILMFMLIMPFMMVQPTESAAPPMDVATISMTSTPGAAVAGAVSAYLGTRFEA